jgi:hypothetical protein
MEKRDCEQMSLLNKRPASTASHLQQVVQASAKYQHATQEQGDDERRGRHDHRGDESRTANFDTHEEAHEPIPAEYDLRVMGMDGWRVVLVDRLPWFGSI